MKIDRSFVAAMNVRQPDRALVMAVLAMATALGLLVVAEGVENADQAEALLAAGCPLAQGFLYSAGVPATLLPAVVAALAGPPGGEPRVVASRGPLP